ncbi:MAG: hypothetical protein ACP5G0_09125 [Desulfomonilia bacterium]
METILLSNGITVEVEDKTVLITGDLYLIHLEISMVADLGEEDEELRRYCGENRLRRTRVLKKPAIHARDVDEVKQSMKQSFLATNLPYMEHPKFLERFKSFSLTEFKEREKEEQRIRDLEDRERDLE